VCQIYKFKDKFLNSKNRDMYLKVVWREKYINNLLKNVKFVDEVIENCKNSNTYKKFIILNILKHKLIFWNYCQYKDCEFYNSL
jgi:hypothetical protein